MSEAAAESLTAETLPAYLVQNASAIGDGGLKLPSDSSQLTATAIMGGNVNYAFRVAIAAGDDVAESTCFVKQAPEFVAIFGPDGYPLTSERMQKEVDVYNEWRTILGEEFSKKYIPDLYLFDRRQMVFVMEFLDGYDLFDHVLVSEKGTFHPAVATSLGDFMGKTHAATHSSQIDPERVEYLTKHFENRPMRGIQLEFVFTKAYKEATDEQRAGLDMNDAFLAEIELLKKQYDGKGDPQNLVLSHGDLHPGSVMVTDTGDMKVIDPEFTVYGPPGLDVGSLLSGFVLAAIHQAHSNNAPAVLSLCEGARAIWSAYKTAMTQGGVEAKYLDQIEVETVGFTVAEVCRTALEFAGGRKWLQFDDPVVKEAAKKAALEVVNACMIARHDSEGGAIELLLEEMKKHSVV